MIEPTQYRLRAAIPFDNEQVPKLVYWTATNLDNKSAVETCLDYERSRELFKFVYGEHGDSQLELLEAQGQLDLVKQRNGETHCIVNSPELLPFNFPASELRF
jgi:hypothetical protein